MIVPDILQRLIAHHGIDVVALRDELSQHGRHRTRTWLAGGGTPRHVIQTLPTAFPPFKAVVVDGELRVEMLRLGAGATFESGATYSRLSMPWPDLPETIIDALPGRPLSQLIGHPGIGRTTTITRVTMKDDDDIPRMVLVLDMPRASLTAVDTAASERDITSAPQIEAIIEETHDVLDVPALDEESTVDTRTWAAAIGPGTRRIIGLRVEYPVTPDEAHIAIRFPYDKNMVDTVGRAGMGAWFDRNGYAWQLEPTARAIAWLREFMATCDIVVGPRGRIHCRRSK